MAGKKKVDFDEVHTSGPSEEAQRFYELTFVQFHSSLFIDGITLGDKVSVKNRKIKMYWDNKYDKIWISFNGKITAVPIEAAMSINFAEVPTDIQYLFNFADHASNEAPSGPAFTRKKTIETTSEGIEYDASDESPEAHRARVRAASANSNKPQVFTQSDALIQQSRMQAMAPKFQGQQDSRAQVSTPTSPTSVQGKPKAISHAQLNAQLAAENKPNQG